MWRFRVHADCLPVAMYLVQACIRSLFAELSRRAASSSTPRLNTVTKQQAPPARTRQVSGTVMRSEPLSNRRSFRSVSSAFRMAELACGGGGEGRARGWVGSRKQQLPLQGQHAQSV